MLSRILLLFMILPAFARPNLDLITLSGGSWIVKESSGKIATYNKAPIDLYLSSGNWKHYASVPITFTIEGEFEGAERRGQFGVGDLQLRTGYKIGFFEPRIGLIVPGAYTTEKAWIGSQDLKALAGLAIGNSFDKGSGFCFSGETQFHITLSKSFGLSEPGSMTNITFLKLIYNYDSGLSTGAELLTTYSSTTWEWSPNERTGTLTLVPQLLLSKKIMGNEFGIKAGAGPTINSVMSDASNDFNISVNIYANLFR